ncbi:DMT family transporter [Hoeflea sp. 108]|uniref:DMT family transporter n=1 Tax=Hoeflea sp. 108 TaxID=1116369 RepID=UPI00036E7AF8|nr:DMT family transporter [Hoeflea sp. 108]
MTSQKPAETATPTSAILLIFASGLVFSFLDTSAKHLVTSGLAAPFVTWVRFAVHAVLVLVLFKAWRRPERLVPQSLSMQILRAVFMFGSTIFNFAALQTLQLAETVSINFASPMVITALAGPMLGEWAGWRRWLAVGVGFLGVIVITRPGFGGFGIGHLFSICAMLSSSLYNILTRKMGGTETAESLILYSAVVPAIFMLPALPLAGSMPAHLYDWLVLFGLGVFGGFGHWLLIKAYMRATATALAPYPYLQMVWMIILGWLVFDQLPDRWTLAGATIIVGSGLYIVHREHTLRVRNRAALNAEAEELAKKL